MSLKMMNKMKFLFLFAIGTFLIVYFFTIQINESKITEDLIRGSAIINHRKHDPNKPSDNNLDAAVAKLRRGELSENMNSDDEEVPDPTTPALSYRRRTNVIKRKSNVRVIEENDKETGETTNDNQQQAKEKIENQEQNENRDEEEESKPKPRVSAQSRSKVERFHSSIMKKERKVYSQNNEDGVIQALLEFLKITEPGYYVEFGTENGLETNTRYLREKKGWEGLLMDGSNENSKINLHKETISHRNILKLLKKYEVPIELDIFSEDTDYGDYWIVEKVLTKYKPKILIHEVNQQTPDKCVTVPKPTDVKYWDNSDFHGGSVCAFRCLARSFDYTMVYCESAGVNCFWLRNDLLQKNLNIEPSIVFQLLTAKHLYKKPSFTYHSGTGQWHQIRC